MSVRVKDRLNRPVISSISLKVGEIWVDAGETDQNGAYRRREGCGGAMLVRALPLDHSYFPSTPKACRNLVEVTVRERTDPVLASLAEHDSDRDGRLDRAEFITFLAAANAVEWAHQTARGQAADQPDPMQRGQTVHNVRLLRSAPEVRVFAYGEGSGTILRREHWAPLATTLGLGSPTIVQGSGSSGVRGLRELMLTLRAASTDVRAPLVVALNETSYAFSLLDRDKDGFLKEEEAALLVR
jgi:hypothetical protein